MSVDPVAVPTPTPPDRPDLREQIADALHHYEWPALRWSLAPPGIRDGYLRRADRVLSVPGLQRAPEDDPFDAIAQAGFEAKLWRHDMVRYVRIKSLPDYDHDTHFTGRGGSFRDAALDAVRWIGTWRADV